MTRSQDFITKDLGFLSLKPTIWGQTRSISTIIKMETSLQEGMTKEECILDLLLLPCVLLPSPSSPCSKMHQKFLHKAKITHNHFKEARVLVISLWEVKEAGLGL